MSSVKFLGTLLDGANVDWMPLGDVVTIQRGKRLVKSQLEEIGTYAVFQNSMTPLGYYHESNVQSDTAFVVAAGAAGEIGYSDYEFWAADDIYFCLPSNKVRQKYLYHFLLMKRTEISSQVRRASIPRLSKAVIEKLEIPIPCPDNPKKSLEIQAEIVRILDAFTELTTELTTRKKQYNHYRDQLLSFEDGEVEWKTLGEIAKKISSGGTPQTGVKEYWEGGTVPWMSSGEVNLKTIYETERFITEAGLKNSSAKFVPRNSLVIALAGQGKTRGKVARTRIDLTTNQSLASITVDETVVNHNYLYHFLKTQYTNLRQISSGSGTRGGLNLQMISSYRFPLPCPSNPKKSLTEQARIVDILDKFDALTNSLTEGLPREIELRQKQYEHYRDLLLSFPRLEREMA